MTRNKRSYNPNSIKQRRSYSFIEIAEKLEIHVRTVQVWRKAGLKVIDESKRPLLIFGKELRRFIKDMITKRRHSLKIDEFFCVRCRKPRKSRPNKLTFQIINKKLGKDSLQAKMKGACEVCGLLFTRFSSDKKIKEAQENGVLFMQGQEVIFGSKDSPLNTDKTKDE